MEQVLRTVRPGLRVVNLRRGMVYRLIDRLLLPAVLGPLVRARLFTVAREDGRGGLETVPGLLRRVTWVEGYFQRQAFVTPELSGKILLRKPLLAAARDILDSLPSGRRKIFVHVRRSDYLTFPVFGQLDPSLPLSYYRRLMQSLAEEALFFVFVSDDPDWVEANFKDVAHKYVSRNPAGVDLALMGLCDGGILSNSSLSWWGGYLMRPGSRRYCPEFWLGWKAGKWHPDGIKPDFAEPVRVIE